MEDYFPKEIPIILDKYVELNKVEDKTEQEVGAEDF